MNAYRKGSNAERELASLLSNLFGVPVHRTARPYLPGLDSRAPDCFGLRGIHIESKKRERLSLGQSIAQAERDACGAVPVVMSRANREAWLCTVRLDDLPRLAKTIAELADGGKADNGRTNSGAVGRIP